MYGGFFFQKVLAFNRNCPWFLSNWDPKWLKVLKAPEMKWWFAHGFGSAERIEFTLMKISNPFKRWVSSEERCTLGINLYRRPTDLNTSFPWQPSHLGENSLIRIRIEPKKCITKIIPSISKCPHFPSPRASTKAYRNQNPVSKSILFPKKNQAHVCCLVRFHPKKKTAPQILRLFLPSKKTPKPPKPRSHLSHPQPTVSGWPS